MKTAIDLRDESDRGNEDDPGPHAETGGIGAETTATGETILESARGGEGMVRLTQEEGLDAIAVGKDQEPPNKQR